MATVNRFTRVSPSQFTPRTAEEVMAIPISKQMQHDASSEGLSKLNEFDFNRLSGDDEISVQELANYRGKVDKAVDNLANKGVGPVNRQSIMDLDRELKRNMSATGKWGKRMANQKAVAALQKEFNTKEGRDGWDHASANAFLQMQVQDFKTDNEDGSTNTFQGQYLPTYVDKGDTFDDILKTIGENSSDPNMKQVLKGGYDTFFESTILTGKQKNQILATVGTAMLSDKKFRASYNVENMVSGSPEDKPFDLGKFDEETGEFIPTSQLGSYLNARSAGAASSKTSRTTHKITDRLGLHAAKKDFDARYTQTTSDGSIFIDAQVMDGMTVESFKGFEQSLSQLQDEISFSAKELKRTDLDTNTRQRLQAKLIEDSNQLQDIKSQIDNAKINVSKGFSDEEQKTYNNVNAYKALTKDENNITLDIKSQITNFTEIGYNPQDGLTEERQLELIKEQYFEDKGIELPRTVDYVMPVTTPGSPSINFMNIDRTTEEQIKSVENSFDTFEDQITEDTIEFLASDKAQYSVNANIIRAGKGATYNKYIYEMQEALGGNNFNPTGWAIADGSGNLVAIPQSTDDQELDMSRTFVGLSTTTSAKGDAKFLIQFFDKTGRPMEGDGGSVFASKGDAGNNISLQAGQAMVGSRDGFTVEQGWRQLANSMDPLVRRSGIRTHGKQSGTVPSREGLDPIKWEHRNNGFVLINEEIESTNLKTPSDVSLYLYLFDRLGGSLEAQRSFVSIYGLKELKKYKEQNKESE